MSLKYKARDFWKYIENKQNELEIALKQNDRDVIAEYQHALDDLSISICGCGVELEVQDGFFELTFQTQGNKTAQYISALLKKEAPDYLLDTWIINTYRQPLSELAYHTVFDIKGKTYSGTDFMVYYTIDTTNKCIPIKVYCEGLLQLTEDKKMEVVHMMLELFIGELELEARIGEIEILDQPADEENFCLMPNFFEDICDIIIDNEWIEYRDPTQIYLAYKIDDVNVKNALRQDMKLIVTTHPQLQEELLNHEDEICRELKNLGGEYGFLYYEPTQEKEQIALVRQQLEKEVNDLLYPMSIARTIGGAIGTQYAYIDVAIFDSQEFMTVLKKMQEHLPFDIYYKAYV